MEIGRRLCQNIQNDPINTENPKSFIKTKSGYEFHSRSSFWELFACYPFTNQGPIRIRPCITGSPSPTHILQDGNSGLTAILFLKRAGIYKGSCGGGTRPPAEVLRHRQISHRFQPAFIRVWSHGTAALKTAAVWPDRWQTSPMPATPEHPPRRAFPQYNF